MNSTKPSLKRLLQLMERQSEPAWSADYKPANLVSSRESPRCSRPAGCGCEKLGGREIQLQSRPERFAALLALYHPNVFDLHEQKILFVEPCQHPLVGHPTSIGMSLPSLKGTVAVADRLGMLARHAVVGMPTKTPGEHTWVPFPFIGDFLLFLNDSIGPFCVNWTIKKDEESFQFRLPGLKPKPISRSPEVGELQRHEIEAEYYGDADIPTYRIPETRIDKEVSMNLASLFLWHARKVLASSDVVARALADFERGIGRNVSAFDLVKQVVRDHSLTQETAKLILKKGIWNRHLRVDMFRPILDDRPLQPEVLDVIDVYGEWFQRSPS